MRKLQNSMATGATRIISGILGPSKYESLLCRVGSDPNLCRRFKGRAWINLYCSRFTSDQIRLAELPGYKLWVNIREPLGYLHYFFRENLPPPPLLRLLSKVHTFFDIGSNMGGWALYVAGAGNPSAQVHAFEPNPRNAELITRSIHENGFENRVTVDRRAVSESSHQRLTFYLSTDPQNSGQSSIVNHGYNTDVRHTLEVTTVTFDDYCAERGIESVDFAKIDVERAEAMVVRGMAGMLARRRVHYAYVELNVGEESHHLLLAAGYTAFFIDKTTGMMVPAAQAADGDFLDLLFVNPDRLAEFQADFGLTVG